MHLRRRICSPAAHTHTHAHIHLTSLAHTHTHNYNPTLTVSGQIIQTPPGRQRLTVDVSDRGQPRRASAAPQAPALQLLVRPHQRPHDSFHSSRGVTAHLRSLLTRWRCSSCQLHKWVKKRLVLLGKVETIYENFTQAEPEVEFTYFMLLNRTKMRTFMLIFDFLLIPLTDVTDFSVARFRHCCSRMCMLGCLRARMARNAQPKSFVTLIGLILSEHERERGTFLAGSDAGFRHGAGPPVGEVRLDHTGLSAIPLYIFLYLLQRQRRRRR